MDLCLTNPNASRLIMFEDTGLIVAMGNMLRRLLTPIVRLLLKHSFSYGAFEGVARRVFVDVALEMAGETGRKPSVSRAAVITGMTRKEISTLVSHPWTGADVDSKNYNRAARVVAAWMRSEELRAGNGRPRPLSVDEFAELVKRAGDDVPYRAVLDELVRVGSVQQGADGAIALVDRAFVPSDSMKAKINILGTDTCELLETIIYNIEYGTSDNSRYQRKVMHTGIPTSALPAFRELSANKAQELLELFDRWLSERDLSAIPEDEWRGTAQTGVGIYYYEKISDAGENLK
jgi:hypothetical protein